MPSSGRFNKVHSDERRHAITTAVLDQGMSQRAARRAAEAGELPDVGPFKVSAGTISNWIVLERRARMPNVVKVVTEDGPEAMVDAVRLRLSTLLEQDLAKLERKQQRDPRELERLASAASRIASMQASPNRNGKGTADQDPEDGDGSSPLVATLSSAASTSTATAASGDAGRSTTPRTQDAEPPATS